MDVVDILSTGSLVKSISSDKPHNDYYPVSNLARVSNLPRFVVESAPRTVARDASPVGQGSGVRQQEQTTGGQGSNPTSGHPRTHNLGQSSSASSTVGIIAGFMAESYVRPPVNVFIDFEDPMPADRLQSLEVGLELGSQRTLGFDVFVGCGPAKDVLVKVAHFVVGQEDDASVNSVSVRFGTRTQNVSVWPNRLKALGTVKSLAVRIFKSKGCPCISFLRLWVDSKIIPMLTGDKKTLPPKTHELRVVPNSHFHQPSTSSATKLSLPRTETSITASKLDSLIDPEIPPEFLDQITFDLMTLPILLPCGKSIDRSTLERVIGDQAQTGKSPMDPFTNIPFSGQSVPLPNRALKARMDAFWTRKPDVATANAVARTLCGPDFDAFPNTRSSTRQNCVGSGSGEGSATAPRKRDGSHLRGIAAMMSVKKQVRTDRLPDNSPACSAGSDSQTADKNSSLHDGQGSSQNGRVVKETEDVDSQVDHILNGMPSFL